MMVVNEIYKCHQRDHFLNLLGHLCCLKFSYIQIFEMPEGPELHIASLFVNNFAKSYKFSGKVIKSVVSLKNPSIDWDVAEYNIHAESRGKEVKLWLEESPDLEVKNQRVKKISILFRFGMSGSFKTSPIDDLPKHSHLR